MTVVEKRAEYNRLLESAFNLDDVAEGLERYGKYNEADEMRLLAVRRREKMKELDGEIMALCFPKGTAPADESERGRERE